MSRHSSPSFMPRGMDWRGYFFPSGLGDMTKRTCRVAVFIDGQNVHQDFRRAFCDPHDSSRIGAFDPMALAGLIVRRGPDFEDWTLTEVRTYVGSPNSSRERVAAVAHDRQVAAWRAAGVTVRARPLLYPEDWPRQRARQKGVDVELAVDVVQQAIAGEYEVGVVASTDTDLVPAIEAVYRLRGSNPTPRICVVSYAGLPKRIRLPDTRGPAIYSFELSRADFEAVQDTTDYRETPASG